MSYDKQILIRINSFLAKIRKKTLTEQTAKMSDKEIRKTEQEQTDEMVVTCSPRHWQSRTKTKSAEKNDRSKQYQ